MLRKTQDGLRFPHIIAVKGCEVFADFKKRLNLSSHLAKHTMTDFGSNFRKLREWAGLSQEALGITLNVSASVINRIENNKRKLDIQILQKLAATLQLDIVQVVKVLFKGKAALPRQKAPKFPKALQVPA